MKPKINNNGNITEFDNDQEHNLAIQQISPTPDLTDYIKSLEHEQLGKQTVKDLYVTLSQQNLTQAQEGDLLNRIYPVLGTLSDGFIRGARVIANMIPVAGQYTQGRKDYLLARIDEAITKL